LVGPRSGLLPNATLLQSMCLDLEYNQGAFPGQAGRLAMGCLEALGLAALASLDPMGLSGPDSYAAQAALAISRGPTLFVLERPLDLLGPRLLGRILDAMREKADSGGAVLVLGRLAAGYPEGQFDRILSLEGIPSKSWRRNDETPILNG
ncbi:MAG: hypothetical protein LBL95_04250, partial [Deltaproteobacteria bacterium]|nr:hypothetical protein [Deltaproteobacteria bacterium]